MRESGFTHFSSPETTISRKRANTGEVVRKAAKNSAFVEPFDQLDHAADGAGKRLVEAWNIGVDQRSVLREARFQRGNIFVERLTGIVAEVPITRDHVRQEAVELLRIGDQLRVKMPEVPVEQDVADVEDDGLRALAQPWRALNRRLVLLIT